MLNKVMLIGHLGSAPEGRNLGDGSRVVNLSVATSESWKDKASGEKKERTEWHRVAIWNEVAGRAAEDYAEKGTKVYVEGEIRSRKWTDDKGQERTAFEIHVGRFNGAFRILGGGKDRRAGTASPATASPATANHPADLDDDIPF